MKVITRLLNVVFFAMLMGGLVGNAMESVSVAFIVMFLSLLTSLLGGNIGSSGVLMLGAPHIWAKKLLVDFAPKENWFSYIKKRNDLIEGAQFHISRLGDMPNVLIDNTTYPLGATPRTDTEKVIPTRKFETEVTIVTEDEIAFLAHPKLDTVLPQQRLALEQSFVRSAAHTIAPLEDTSETPVIETTGSPIPYHSGTYKNSCTRDDILNIREKLILQGVPIEDCVLVLCPQHVTSLISKDKEFGVNWSYNSKDTGKKYLGFSVSEYAFNPFFNTAGKKMAYKTGNELTNRPASFIFAKSKAAYGLSKTSTSLLKAENNPRMAQSEFSSKLYGAVGFYGGKGIGAIISGTV